MSNLRKKEALERWDLSTDLIMIIIHFQIQAYALKVMKKVGENVPSFYCEERDIMARTTSPWHTKLDYAFQVKTTPHL